jgi:hypothetical protein
MARRADAAAQGGGVLLVSCSCAARVLLVCCSCAARVLLVGRGKVLAVRHLRVASSQCHSPSGMCLMASGSHGLVPARSTAGRAALEVGAHAIPPWCGAPTVVIRVARGFGCARDDGG